MNAPLTKIDIPPAMREWLTAAEIADEKLRDMPHTESAIIRYAARECWNDLTHLARPREGRGGGMEYHYRVLPMLAQTDYLKRYMVVGVTEDIHSRPLNLTTEGLTARQQKERDARLAIVSAYNTYARGLNSGHAYKVNSFVGRYNAGAIAVSDWIRGLVPTLSERTLTRWRSLRRNGLVSQLAVDPAQSRKGTGILDTANDGKVKEFVLALVAHQPHLSADHIREQCRAEFGDEVVKRDGQVIAMPPLRTFQAFLKTLKADNHVVLTKITNPDLYRSTMAPAGYGANRHITEPNALWQIDASPVDALCTDGRQNMYACVDIATRRAVTFISKTPRASAVALLIRKAILAWGVPDAIKTDNGSDFVAQDTKRLFGALGIEMLVSDAYSPQQKGHVERFIGTWQRGFCPLLPGYIGHDVADRKAIECRKAYAARQGVPDINLFGVEIESKELQRLTDEWVGSIYAHKPHAGLQNRTPFQVYAAASHVIQRVDERALDLLVMPVAGKDGLRTTTKRGIRIDHFYYTTPTVLPGVLVLVRQDPADAGNALLFEPNGGAYLGKATCAELAGLHPQTIMKATREAHAEVISKKAKEIKADIKRLTTGAPMIERALRVAARKERNVTEFPKREAIHSTPQIAAAIDAMVPHATAPASDNVTAMQRQLLAELSAENTKKITNTVDAAIQRSEERAERQRTAHLPDIPQVIAMPEQPLDRYRRALKLLRAIEHGEPVSPDDAMWVTRYQMGSEFKAQAVVHEVSGDRFIGL